MEHVKEFLDTSTIHGLSWISGTRKWSRYFWILTVILGFSGAGYLIYTSFDNWEQSPISTTIETLPISQIKFPNVTVCPPRNSFLNLNFDLEQSEKIKIDNSSRRKLFDFALDAKSNSVVGDQNTTLMFDIKKETMKEVSDNDKMHMDPTGDIDADLKHWSKNFSEPSGVYRISLYRGDRY